MTVPIEDSELDAYRKEQMIEYGTWEAIGDIHFDGVLAYRKGDPVPVSNVKKYGYDKAKLVRKVES